MASYSSYDVRQADWRKSVYVNDVDLFVITGARASVCDADPWMMVLEDFVRDVWWTQAKMLGICFGHQIVAKAMGGRVARHHSGWNAGVVAYQWQGPPAWLRNGSEGIRLLAIHQDQVIEVSKAGRVVAGNERCLNGIVLYGDRFLTIQAHPEHTPGFTKALISRRVPVGTAVCGGTGSVDVADSGDARSLSEPVWKWLTHD